MGTKSSPKQSPILVICTDNGSGVMLVFRRMVRRSPHFCGKRAFSARSPQMSAGRTFVAYRTCMDCAPKKCSLSHK